MLGWRFVGTVKEGAAALLVGVVVIGRGGGIALGAEARFRRYSDCALRAACVLCLLLLDIAREDRASLSAFWKIDKSSDSRAGSEFHSAPDCSLNKRAARVLYILSNFASAERVSICEIWGTDEFSGSIASSDRRRASDRSLSKRPARVTWLFLNAEGASMRSFGGTDKFCDSIADSE